MRKEAIREIFFSKGPSPITYGVWKETKFLDYVLSLQHVNAEMIAGAGFVSEEEADSKLKKMEEEGLIKEEKLGAYSAYNTSGIEDYVKKTLEEICEKQQETDGSTD